MEREQLTVEFGRDPVELLRGVAANEPGARGLANNVRHAWGGAMELRLLRFGLAHPDERVVFGATILLESGPGPAPAVPELGHAAAIVVPRLGAPDCPVTCEQAVSMFGSGDFARIGPVLQRLPEGEAVAWLGQLHRMVRSDSIPALCDLARSTEGRVRDEVLSNAWLAARYSQQHVPLLLATCLELVGRRPDPDPVGAGLPGLLTAVLRASIEGLPTGPGFPGLRWLMSSTPASDDLPLLRSLLTSSAFELRETAAWALGALRDEASLALLLGPAPERVPTTLWTAALARRGDDAALETLFAAHGDQALPFALALASPERRRRFFEHLLTCPTEQALQKVDDLGVWARGELCHSFADPLYDDRYLAELEPMVAAAERLDVQLLRAVVKQLPCCETQRLADALLARPVSELFSGDCELSDRYPNGQIGHSGVWSFLEVTRPQVFRDRLREGLGSDEETVRDACARMLIRLGDTERIAALAAWIDAGGDDGYEPLWMHLARDGATEVRQLLHARVAASEPGDVDDDLLRALAVALGMPFRFARHWEIADVGAVREALLAGDAAAAFLCSPNPSSRARPLLAWRHPAVSAFLRGQRDSQSDSALAAFAFDQEAALALDDRATLDRMLEPVRDGRYATHDDTTWLVAAQAGGLDLLPFWIDQLGSNCCKAVFADLVLQQLFQQESWAFDRCNYAEPASVWLRRTLLPVADRLRWSRIANGYVVAGR